MIALPHLKAVPRQAVVAPKMPPASIAPAQLMPVPASVPAGFLSLPVETVVAPTVHYALIELNTIEAHPSNPRMDWSGDDELNALAQSLRNHGTLQPVVLRPRPGQPGRYQLIAGERRWRAAGLAGLQAIAATVRELSDAEALEVCLAENLERKDLNAIEKARLLTKICEPVENGGAGLTHEKAAARFGHQGCWATNLMRLLRLPEAWQQRVCRGELSERQARELVPYCDRPDVLARVDADMKANPWAWQTAAAFSRNLALIVEGKPASPVERAPSAPRNPPATIGRVAPAALSNAKAVASIASSRAAISVTALPAAGQANGDACPDCGWSPVKGHRCGVPVLVKAIGLELTAAERQLVKWMAQTDRETVERLAALFERVRGESISESVSGAS